MLSCSLKLWRYAIITPFPILEDQKVNSKYFNVRERDWICYVTNDSSSEVCRSPVRRRPDSANVTTTTTTEMNGTIRGGERRNHHPIQNFLFLKLLLLWRPFYRVRKSRFLWRGRKKRTWNATLKARWQEYYAEPFREKLKHLLKVRQRVNIRCGLQIVNAESDTKESWKDLPKPGRYTIFLQLGNC